MAADHLYGVEVVVVDVVDETGMAKRVAADPGAVRSQPEALAAHTAVTLAPKLSALPASWMLREPFLPKVIAIM